MSSYQAAPAPGFPPPTFSPSPPLRGTPIRSCLGSGVKSSPSAAIIISLKRTVLTNLRLEPELGKPVGEGREGRRERGATETGRWEEGCLEAPIVYPKQRN